MIWQRYPVFRIFLIYCSGILLANFTDTSFSFFAVLTGLSLVLVPISAFAKTIFSTYSRRWFFGLSLNVFFFSLGVFITHLYSELHASHHLRHAPAQKTFYLLQLMDDPKEKERSVGVRAEVIALKDSSGYSVRNAQLMLYLQKSDLAGTLSYGDRILFYGTLNELQPPMNPYEFDYRDYLHLKAIYYQGYADSSNWERVSRGHGFMPLKVAKDFRKKMLAHIDTWPLNTDQKAVTKALLLGYRFDIEDELLRAYSSAGAMHVLAVSGLHVGIVYLMAAYLLFFLDRIKHGTAIKMVILILLLWSYAMITGLSASVVRASTMFTFVAIGTGFKRYTSIYNTILGSAILLMLFKPTFLFEVGFQLSYAAVFGIVWLQPRFEKLWKPQNWFVKQFWGITTVSIAAQIATFPLGLYYFHQFPTLFLISNWIVIPIVTVLMYFGLVALVLSSLGLLWAPIVYFYAGCLWLMNRGVSFIEEQAAFLIDQVHITRLELVLLYAFILFIFSWSFRGNYYRLVSAMVILVIFGFSQSMEALRFRSERQMVVYSIRGQPAIGLYENGRGVFISDSTLWSNDDALTFHVKHHWWASDVEEVKFCPLNEDISSAWLRKHGDFLSFGNQRIYLPTTDREKILPAHCWIVNDTYPPPILLHKPGCVILCGRLSYLQRSRWKEWGQEMAITIWDTAERGAYVQNFSIR